MTWQMEYYNIKVAQQVERWPDGILAVFMRTTRMMMQYGPDLGMPHTKALGAGLFEIRAKGREGIGRAFYCTHVSHCIVILHAFVKKTQKTPPRELAIARRRLQEVKT